MKNILFVLVVLNGLFFSNLSVAAPGDGELSEDQKRLLETLPPDQRESILVKMRKASRIDSEVKEAFEETNTLIKRPEKEILSSEEKSEDWIYGYEQFQSSPTTFAPTATMPVPADFLLGPGDEINVHYNGNNIESSKEVISRSGQFNLPSLGPVTLAGLTFSEAQDLVDKKVSNELIGTSVALTLTKLKSVTVYVLGEAYSPGTYTISALSSLTNLLFVSGGVNENGSVRNIEVKRNGETIHIFDLYDLLIKGDTKSDIRLQAGDVVFIPLIKKTARAEGHFRRPHLYELTEGDQIKDLIFYAGGFTSKVTENAKIELSTIDSKTNRRELSVFFFNEVDKLSKKAKDGDSIKVFEYGSLEESSITLFGEVKFPGTYTVQKGERLLDIINRAGGLSEQGYAFGAVFTRKNVARNQKASFKRSADFLEQAIADAITIGSLNLEGSSSLAPVSALISRLRNTKPVGRLVIDADPLAMKTDPVKNILIEGGDSLYVPKRPSAIYVVGEIYSPSTHTFDSSASIQEYINKSGGLRKTADSSNIYVIFPNGEAHHPSSKKRFFSQDSFYILPGSTIVIPRNPRPWDWVVVAQTVTPILANLATSAAALAAVSNY